MRGIPRALTHGRVSKFGAKPTVRNGRRYASKAEADYRDYLALLERAGEIRDVEEQPVVLLEPGIKFRPDFAVTELERDHPKRRVWIDVKGVETQRFTLICKLWALHGPGPLRVVKRGRSGLSFVTAREIVPAPPCPLGCERGWLFRDDARTKPCPHHPPTCPQRGGRP